MKRKSQKKIGAQASVVSSLPSKNLFLAISVKTCAKEDIKVFWSSPISLDFLTFGKIFF